MVIVWDKFIPRSELNYIYIYNIPEDLHDCVTDCN